MKTSCVILNYNDSETTLGLLNLIKEYRELDYIVIVDNNSTDNSYEILKMHESSKIFVIKSEKNGGYGYGNNVGIKYAYYALESTYILIANPDVLFTEECVANLKEAFKKHKECAIIGPNQIYKGKPVVWKRPNDIQDVLSASIFCNRLLRKKMPYYDSDYFSNKESCYVYAISGSLLMVDAEKMIQYGMYDEEIFLYYEELVLAEKFEKNGLKTMLLINQDYIHNHSTTVKKNFKSIITPKKCLLNSKLYFLKEYRKFNRLQLLLARAFFKLTIIEAYIIQGIKSISGKR